LRFLITFKRGANFPPLVQKGKEMKKIILLVILSVMFYLVPSSGLMAVEARFIKEIILSEKDGLIIEKPDSFIVTEDDNILVSDSKAGNIKIFDMKGNRLSIFGRKGVGPNEFVRPRLIAYHEPFVVFADNGRDFFFIYKRTGENNFQYIDRYMSLAMAQDDFQMIDENNLLIAGEKYGIQNGEQMLYILYQYNLKNKTPDLIIPIEEAFGLNSLNQYRNERDQKLQYIGLLFFVDFSDDSIYLVWTSDLKITRIDRKTRTRKYFGKKTENFVTPYFTKEIKNAFHQMKPLLIYKLRRNMSYVRDIFVSRTNKIGVTYVGPFKSDDTLRVMLQLYETDGQFLKEIAILNSRASNHYEVYFYFRKNDNRFYIMDTDTSKKDDHIYKIYEYRIEE
jgi:hypothetical protein